MKRFILWAAACAIAVAGVALFWVAEAGSAASQIVVRYDADSKYYHINVVDFTKEGRRCLLFSKTQGIQSSMFLNDPAKLDLIYTKSMTAALALHPAPKSVLLVGLGGASLPKFIQKNYPDLKLDIVDIDPDVVKVCQAWFEFKPAKNTRVIVMDGRMFLKRATETYDIIMLDAYAGDRIPFHMTTQEFVALVKTRLAPGGLVATNLWEHQINRFYTSECKTYQAAFPQTYLCKCTNSGNVILFGTLDDKAATKDEWAKRAEKLAEGKDFGFSLPALIREQYSYLTPTKIAEKPLTDDDAAPDLLRRENPKFFEEEAGK
jgi:spermidine synthase